MCLSKRSLNKSIKVTLIAIQAYIIFLSSSPADTATLWQLCDNVVVDFVTTLWHGRKWELYRSRFPTLWQRRSPTLSRRSSTLLQRHHNIKHWITRPLYYRLFSFLSLHRKVKVTKVRSGIKHASFLFKKRRIYS